MNLDDFDFNVIYPKLDDGYKYKHTYLGVQEAITLLKTRTGKEYTSENLAEYVKAGRLRACFEYAGKLTRLSLLTNQNLIEHTYEEITFKGYLEPHRTETILEILESNSNIAAKVSEVQLIESTTLKTQHDIDYSYNHRISDVEFYTVKDYYRVNGGSIHPYVKTLGIDIYKNDILFTEIDLKKISDGQVPPFLKYPLPAAQAANQESELNGLDDFEKENLIIIAVLVNFILKKIMIKAPLKFGHAPKDLSTQKNLIAALEVKFKERKYITESDLTKKVGIANNFLKESKYGKDNRKITSLPIIIALRDFILTSNAKTRTAERVCITNQDQLIEQLTTLYQGRSFLSEEILRQKFSHTNNI